MNNAGPPGPPVAIRLTPEDTGEDCFRIWIKGYGLRGMGYDLFLTS